MAAGDVESFLAGDDGNTRVPVPHDKGVRKEAEVITAHQLDGYEE